MARAPPRRSTLGTYRLILAPAPQSNAALQAGGGTCISQVTLDRPQPAPGFHFSRPRGVQATSQHSFRHTTQPSPQSQTASDVATATEQPPHRIPHGRNPLLSDTPASNASQPRLQPFRLRQSPFRCARHPPTLSAVDLAASTYWHDLSLCRDARRDVARCCWRRTPHRQHTWAPHAPAPGHPSPCSLRPACKSYHGRRRRGQARVCLAPGR